MRETFLNCLVERANVDSRIVLVSADMGYSVLEPFMEQFPDRFFNVGISEQNAVSVAAGMALNGKVVYVYSIIPFVTMRCFEQIRVDVAYMNTNVRLVGVGAGYSYGPAGATHHAIEDIAIMRALPNMTVCCPGDPLEARALVTQSFDHKGPMYLRLGKTREPVLHAADTPITLGKAAQVRQGKDIALLTTSTMLEQGCALSDYWGQKGVSIAVYSYHTVKPLDVALIQFLIQEGYKIITLEEHSIIGGLGSAVAEVIAESNRPVPFKRIGIPDCFTHHVGSQASLRKLYHLDSFDLEFQ